MLATDYSGPLVPVPTGGSPTPVFTSRGWPHHHPDRGDGAWRAPHPTFVNVTMQLWADAARAASYRKAGAYCVLVWTLGRVTRTVRVDVTAGVASYGVVADSVDVRCVHADAGTLYAEATVVPGVPVEGVQRVGRYTPEAQNWALLGTVSFPVPDGAAEVLLLLDTFNSPAAHSCQWEIQDSNGGTLAVFSLGQQGDSPVKARLALPNGAATIYGKVNHASAATYVTPVFFIPL